MIQLAEIRAKHSDVFGSLKTTFSPSQRCCFQRSFACSPAALRCAFCTIQLSKFAQRQKHENSQRVWSPSPTAPIDVWERDSDFVKAIPTGKSVADDFSLSWQLKHALNTKYYQIIFISLYHLLSFSVRTGPFLACPCKRISNLSVGVSVLEAAQVKDVKQTQPGKRCAFSFGEGFGRS